MLLVRKDKRMCLTKEVHQTMLHLLLTFSPFSRCTFFLLFFPICVLVSAANFSYLPTSVKKVTFFFFLNEDYSSSYCSLRDNYLNLKYNL